MKACTFIPTHGIMALTLTLDLVLKVVRGASGNAFHHREVLQRALNLGKGFNPRSVPPSQPNGVLAYSAALPSGQLWGTQWS